MINSILAVVLLWAVASDIALMTWYYPKRYEGSVRPLQEVLYRWGMRITFVVEAATISYWLVQL